MGRNLATLAGRLFSGARFTMPAGSGAVYLTFDDGPHPETTPRILELLAMHDARATFFCLGRKVEKYPSVYDSILAGGHATGNHSWSHPNGWTTSTGKYIADVNRAAGLIDSNLFRPPYGRLTPGQYLELKKRYNIIMWTRLFADYSVLFNPAAASLSGIRPGDILVMHDSVKTIGNTLPLLEKLLNLACKNLQFRFHIMPPVEKTLIQQQVQ